MKNRISFEINYNYEVTHRQGCSEMVWMQHESHWMHIVVLNFKVDDKRSHRMHSGGCK